MNPEEPQEQSPNMISLGDINIVSNESLDKCYLKVNEMLSNNKIKKYLNGYTQKKVKQRLLGIG